MGPAITALPRCDVLVEDRQRWADEYDKVQKDLLKPIVASAYVLSLRRSTPLELPRLQPEDTVSKSLRGTQTRSPTTSGLNTLTKTSTMNKTLSPIKRAAREAVKEEMSRARTTSPETTTLAGTMALPSHRSPSPRRREAPTAAEVCSLCTLVQPRVEFKGKVELLTKHMGLTWLLTEKRHKVDPRALFTLETLKDDAYLQDSKNRASNVVLINSPRSILTIMRAGVSVPELLRLPPAEQAAMVLGPNQKKGESEAHTAILAEAMEQQRKELLSKLRNNYRTVCSAMSLADVIYAIDQRMKEADVSAEGAGMFKAQQQKQEATLRAIRSKVEKQQQAQQEAARLVQIHDQRREESEIQKQNLYAQQKIEAARRAKEVEQRMEELREMQARKAEDVAKRAELRKEELLQREQALRETLQRNQEQKKQVAREMREEKEQKINAARGKLEQLILERAHNYELKKEAAQHRKEEYDARRLAEHESKMGKAARAQERRAEAAERMHQEEQNNLMKATLRRQHADERIEQYHQDRMALRAQKGEADLQKAMERKELLSRAQYLIEERKSTMLKNMSVIEENQRKLREERLRQLEDHHLLAQVEQSSKRMFVARQRQAGEFRKLLIMENLQRRSDRLEATAEQRAKVQKQMMYLRDQMHSELSMTSN